MLRPLLALTVFFSMSTIWGEEAPLINSEDTHFFVVIPTHNNANLCIANIKSIVKQTYNNWIAYIIDDCSTDGTADILQAYIDENHLAEHIILIRNTTRRFALANIYITIHEYCNDTSVVVLVDGDDELAHEYVFARVAQAYKDPLIWLTYGQYINIPRKNIGLCRAYPQKIIDQVDFRSYEWLASHLRTFKAWLFKDIELKDLLQDDGTPYRVGWDLAIMFPLLEKAAKGHICFIPDILYKYIHHGKNDYVHSFAAIKMAEAQLRNKQQCIPLSEPVIGRVEKVLHEKADIIIFSYDRPIQLYALLESIEKYMTGIEKITIICRASTVTFEQAYCQIQKQFNHVQFVYQNNALCKADFKSLVVQVVEQAAAPYIMFGVDDIVVKDFVHIPDCIKALEKTFAYGFYLRLGQNINYCYTENKRQPPPIKLALPHDICVWQFKNGLCDWNYPYNLDMTLYRKNDIFILTQIVTYNSPNLLESEWVWRVRPPTTGVCFSQSKVVNIPLNRVQTEWNNRSMDCYSTQELLDKFNQNLKFDITFLHQVPNISPHQEYILPFVQRSEEKLN